MALVVTWSSGFVGPELGSRAHAAPLTLLGWRFMPSLRCSSLWPGCGVRRGRAWRHGGDRRCSACCARPATCCSCSREVTRGVPGGTAALIAALQPLLVATVAGSLLGEHSTPTNGSACSWVSSGVAVVVSGDLGVTPAPLWAYLLPTAGMLCLAVGTVLERRIRPPESLLETIMMQSVVTAATLMSLALAFGQSTPPASLEFWRAVVWLIGAGQPRGLRDVRLRRAETRSHSGQHAAVPDSADHDVLGLPDVRRGA